MPSTKKNVFLSYSHKDEVVVEELIKMLQDRGVEAWSSTTRTQQGDRWVEQAEDALRKSSILVVLLSRETLASRWVFFEIGAAFAAKKRIIPVVIGDVDISNFPASLASFQAIRAQTPSEAANKVANALQEITENESEN